MEVAAVVDFQIALGVAFCVKGKEVCKRRTPAWFVTPMFGYKKDVSFGLGVGITFLKSMSDAPGWAGVAAFGFDLPDTEYGVDVVITHNFDPNLIGFGFQFGFFGVGLNPVDISYNFGYTYCAGDTCTKGSELALSTTVSEAGKGVFTVWWKIAILILSVISTVGM